MDIQREGNQIKWRLFLLTHLQRVTTLPTGSYDDDDILTEAPRGHSRLRRFFRRGSGAGDFCFGVFSSGEIWTGLMTPAGLLDEDGWGHLAVSSEEAYLALSEVHDGEREDTGGPVSIGKCSLPHHAFLIILISRRLEFVVFSCRSCFVMPGCLFYTFFCVRRIFLRSSIAASVKEVLALLLWTLASLTNHAIFFFFPSRGRCT